MKPLDKYLEAEKRLAELFGWHGIWLAQNGTTFIGRKEDGNSKFLPGGQDTLPQWCRDDAAAFRLMVEHEIRPYYWHIRGTVSVENLDIEIAYADHPDKDTAVRYAIVQAVIKKKEAA